MTEGVLVDIRNVGADKDIELKIRCPAEKAQQVIDAFGWPTKVDPVHVVVARMTDEAAQ